MRSNGRVSPQSKVPRPGQLDLRVDAALPTPRYLQLRDALRAALVDRAWPVDAPIPSERALMRLTGLSRTTVRQAVGELTSAGLLHRQHGRGTFLVPIPVEQEVQGVYSFTDRVTRQGRTPSSTLLAREIRPATAEEAEALALTTGDPLIRLTRLRLVDGEPVIVDIVRIPHDLVPGLMTADLSGSLYGLLRGELGRPPLRSTDTLEAVAASAELAGWLGVRPGSPLILMRRLSFTTGDVPLELTEEYARPDRLRYRITLVSEPPFIELTRGAGHERGGDDMRGARR